MTYLRPTFKHPNLPKNTLGYTAKDYEGGLSTLCAGCGHDSISASIAEACFRQNIEPHKVAKLSGIGCSSKTPTYFLGNSHGFNSVHGRMPSVATGASLVNQDLMYFGVSGDGDSASIGMGQFVHAVRRNVNMVYIVMNNGCYGLTKGQDSATADVGSKSKAGSVNIFQPIDFVGLALELGAGFVAQSFSGDKTQLIPLIEAAMKYNGFALINAISPCVTFNNNVGSTKAYDYVRQHIDATGTVDFVPTHDEILAEYAEGTNKNIRMHDGSYLHFSKLGKDWNPLDRNSAFSALQKARDNQEILTGLIYFEEHSDDLNTMLNITNVKPLHQFTAKELSPGAAKLAEVNDGFR